MNKNDNKPLISKQLYNLYCEYQKYKTFIKNQNQNMIFAGYLIDIKLIEKFKQDICYDQLKMIIKNTLTYTYNGVRKAIEKMCDCNKIIKRFIVQSTFENSEKLINALNNNYKYYLINNDLWIKICKIDDVDKKGISFYFEDNNIILIFKDNKIKFKINNGIIEKSSLLNYENIKNEIIKKDNEDNKNIIKNYFQNKYKNHIKILIELFIFHKNINTNLSFKELNEENKNTYYLINNIWIENFKSFFEYNELKKYIHLFYDKNPNIKNDISLSEDNKDKIISNLLFSYINKIINKDLTNIEKTIGKISDNIYIVSLNKKQINFLYDYQIINQKIYGLLLYLEYEFESIKKVSSYNIGNNRLLILFENKEDKYTDEIVQINKENIINPEYLLDYSSSEISKNISNKFISSNFLDFNMNSNKDQFEIFDENNKTIIGHCYKINKNLNSKNDDLLGNNKFLKNIRNKNLINKEIINQNKLNEIGIAQKKGIELFLQIKKHELSIEKDINDPLNTSKIDICHLISRKSINKIRENILYKKINQYIIEKELILLDEENIKQLNSKLSSNFIQEYLKIVLTLNNLTKDIDMKKSELTKLNVDEDITYPENFFIFNDEIYKLLDENKILENEYKNYYKICNGKLIINYENLDLKNHLILVCKKIENKNEFTPEIILNYEGNKEKRNLEFEELKSINNTKFDINNPEIKNNIISNSIYYIKPLNSQNYNIENLDNKNKDLICLELLTNIYIHHEILKRKLNKLLKDSKIQQCFIISKEWIKIFLDKIEYAQFVNLIKGNDIDNIIDKNYENNLNEENINDKIFNEIKNIFKKEYINSINNKLDNKIFINTNLSSVKFIEEIYDKNNMNKSNNIEIINDKIKKLIFELFQIEINNEIKILIGEGKIIIQSNLDHHHSIIIGTLNNNTFEADILLNYKNSFENKFL